jgi:hypothetical protein
MDVDDVGAAHADDPEKQGGRQGVVESAAETPRAPSVEATKPGSGGEVIERRDELRDSLDFRTTRGLSQQEDAMASSRKRL